MEEPTLDLTLKESLLEILKRLDSFSLRIEKVEKRLAKIPDPFIIYYKPPGEEEHQKLNKVLDGLHSRLNNLENRDS